MPLILLTAIREHQPDVERVLQHAGISVYSFGDITGVHTNQSINLSDAWFSAGMEKIDAVFFFSITSEDLAEQVKQKVITFNESIKAAFPIRLFILPVIDSSTT